MTWLENRTRACAFLLLASLVSVSCASRSTAPAAKGLDAEVTRRGSIEVTAKLVEIPEGAIFERELYN